MLCVSCGTPNDDGAARCGECGLPPRDPGVPFLPQGTPLYDGAYAIGADVGVGRFGLTYSASVRGTTQPVIIKELFLEGCGRVGVTLVPRAGWTEDHLDDARQRFLQEGRALARLDHVGLARIEGTFEESNTAYVVMEQLHGKSLARLLQQRGGKLKEADALGYLLKAGEALEAAHRMGVLHGDIKPRNILVVDPVRARESERVVLVDFCTAGRLAVGRGTGTLATSPGYSPPECYAPQVQVGPYTDVYALAAVLYHALTGARPPEAPLRARGPALVTVRQVNPWISPRVAQAVMHGLETDSWRRPQTVSEFLDELRFGRGGVSVPRPLPGHPASPPTPSADRPATARSKSSPPGQGSTPSSSPVSAPAPPPPRPQPREAPRGSTSSAPPRPALAASSATSLESDAAEAWPPRLTPRNALASGRPAAVGFAPLIYSVRAGPTKSRTPGPGEVALARSKNTSMPAADAQVPSPWRGRVRAPAAWACPVPLVSVVRVRARGTALSSRRPTSQDGEPDRRAQAVESTQEGATVADPAGRKRRALAWAVAVILLVMVAALAARGIRPFESNQGTLPIAGTQSSPIAWAAHRQAVTALAFSPDGKQLLSGSRDHTARLWDLDSRRELYTFGVAGAITGVAFSADGTRIATASEDESIRIWTTQGRQLVRIRAGDRPTGIAFSDDGGSLAGRGAPPLLCVWSATTGQPLSSIELPARTGTVRFSGRNTRIVTVDEPAPPPADGPSVRISDLALGRSKVAFCYATTQAAERRTSRLPRACLAENGLIALTCGSTQDRDDWLIAWDVSEGRPIGRSQLHGLEGVLAVSPGGRLALVAVTSRTVAWDIPRGQEVVAFSASSSTLTCGAFSSDGRRFAVGGSDGRLHVVNTMEAGGGRNLEGGLHGDEK